MKPIFFFLTLGLLACGDGSLGDEDANVADAKQEVDSNFDVDSDIRDAAADIAESSLDADSSLNVDCGTVTDQGYELCSQTPTTCSLVFSNGDGCRAACNNVGLTCVSSFEDVEAQCLPDRSRPSLSCGETGHISDFCECGARVGDAGVDATTDASPDAQIDGGACGRAQPWECILDEAAGFGAGVTGGAGGPLCWVENLNSNGAGSLQSCIDAAGPKWIVFRVSGTIQISSAVNSNTTIDGRGQRIVLKGLNTSSVLRVQAGASNVFLTHLHVQKSMNDGVRTFEGASNIWLNHLSLTDADDELVGNDGTSVTISNSYFHDNTYAILAGGQSKHYSNLRLTLHHNLFERCDQRHPFTRGNVHMFNNHILNYGLSGARVSDNGHIYSEANIYEGNAQPGSALRSRPGGSLTINGHYRSVGDRFVGTVSADPDNDSNPVFNPTDAYNYTAETADNALADSLRNNAGWQDTPLPM